MRSQLFVQGQVDLLSRAFELHKSWFEVACHDLVFWS